MQRRWWGVAAAVAVVATAGVAAATPGAGLDFFTLGNGVVAEPLKAKAGHVELKTKGPVRVWTQRITFAPGGASGWHSHPGIVLATVVAGEVARYDGDCARTVVGAGGSFVEDGDEIANTVNEGTEPAVTVFTFVNEPGAFPRVDEPAPDCAD